MTEIKQAKLDAFSRLLDIMDDLRAKCPWDMKQTMDTLRILTIEETYELSDAIIQNNMSDVKEELGDLMLHLVFYAKIAEEKQDFTMADSLHAVCDKLIKRHPHIYGDVTVADEAEVSRNWEKLKLKEGKTSVLEGVPVSLPALVKSIRVQEKARAAGFDWEVKEQVWEKVKEELEEFKREEDAGDQQKMEQEFGDVMFALVNYARFRNINPEEALEKTNKKFIRRFRYMEDRVNEDGKKLSEMDLPEMDKYWDEAKAKGL